MKIDLSAAFNEGGRIFGKAMGTMVLFTLVYILISAVGGSIPFIGTFYSLLIDPVIAAGLIYLIHEAYISQTSRFETGFNGFRQFGGIVIINLVTGIVVGLMFLIVLLPFLISNIGELIEEIQYLEEFQNTTDPDEAMAFIDYFLSLIGMYLPAIIAATLVAAIGSTLFIFAPFYYIVGKQEIGQSITKSVKAGAANMHILLLFLLIISLLAMASIVTLFIGLLWIIPWTQSITYAMYRQLEPGDPQMESQEEVLDL